MEKFKAGAVGAGAWVNGGAFLNGGAVRAERRRQARRGVGAWAGGGGAAAAAVAGPGAAADGGGVVFAGAGGGGSGAGAVPVSDASTVRVDDSSGRVADGLPGGGGVCPTCGKRNEIVNQCRCDPNNLPTKVIA